MTQRANWTRHHNHRILNKIVSYWSWILVHFLSALLHISINGHGSQPHHAANLIRSILRSCVCVRLCVRILRPPHFAAAARFRKFKLCVCAHRLNHANCPRWIAHGRSSAALAILGFDMIMWCAHTHLCVWFSLILTSCDLIRHSKTLSFPNRKFWFSPIVHKTRRSRKFRNNPKFSVAW